MSIMVDIAMQRLRELAEPANVASMQAYMKTDMPFHGVAAPARKRIVDELRRRFPVLERREYVEVVTELWEGEYREEKYLAVAVADRYPEHIVPAQLLLYERMIREGQWWDLVDPVAIHLVGTVVLEHPQPGWSVVDTWIDHDNLWMRRAAIIAQVRAGSSTDADRLFRYCMTRAFETDPFLRKAIGWALRQYSHVDPDAVAEFLSALRDELAPLSYREASRHLRKLGLLDPH